MTKNPLTPTPEDYRNTLLYRTLDEKDKKSRNGFREKVDFFIQEVTPLLNTIGAGAFRDYTIHSHLHSRKLLHLAGFIISQSTLESLSELELAILIMSFYFHDIGMVLSEDQKEEILKSADFNVFMESHKELKDRIDRLRDEIASAPNDKKVSYEEYLAQLYYAALTSYLRPKHANTDIYVHALEKIERDRQDLFIYGSGSFRNEFILLCHSHNEPASYLNKQDSEGEQILRDDLFYKDQRLNLQFCAAVLRLADILDFDAERTPESLFHSLGIEDKKLPGFKVSLKEWSKQMSIRSIVFTDREIEVQSECSSPSVERSVKEMCESIEREIRDTSSFVLKAPRDVSERYVLDLPLVVSPRIKRKGYVDRQYFIHLDESSIISLLMGENLYGRTQVAIRELVQNSIDACVLLSKIDSRVSPHISVAFSRDDDNRVWLMVKDNGIGMDDKVLSNYFFNIGKSYYQSVDFKVFSAKKSISGFTPISRFGIGILSVFMIGDTLKVTTQNEYSINSDTKHRIVIIDPESLAVVNESDKKEQGTTIELRLKREYSDAKQVSGLLSYVKSVFCHPSVTISLTDLNRKTTNVRPSFFNTVSDEKKGLLREDGIEVIEIDLAENSTILRGRANLILFSNIDGTLSFTDRTKRFEWAKGPLLKQNLLSGSSRGFRLSVNGVNMHMKKLNSLLKVGKQRFLCLLDVDVPGIDSVTYDVTRTNIIGSGRQFLKSEIKRSIGVFLINTGYYEKMDTETKDLFKSVFKIS